LKIDDKIFSLKVNETYDILIDYYTYVLQEKTITICNNDNEQDIPINEMINFPYLKKIQNKIISIIKDDINSTYGRIVVALNDDIDLTIEFKGITKKITNGKRITFPIDNSVLQTDILSIYQNDSNNSIKFTVYEICQRNENNFYVKIGGIKDKRVQLKLYYDSHPEDLLIINSVKYSDNCCYFLKPLFLLDTIYHDRLISHGENNDVLTFENVRKEFIEDSDTMIELRICKGHCCKHLYGNTIIDFSKKEKLVQVMDPNTNNNIESNVLFSLEIDGSIEKYPYQLLRIDEISLDLLEEKGEKISIIVDNKTYDSKIIADSVNCKNISWNNLNILIGYSLNSKVEQDIKILYGSSKNFTIGITDDDLTKTPNVIKKEIYDGENLIGYLNIKFNFNLH
jgi:hypothetical protein